jgi:glycosyltransferase involved in cell wall biosynthesis
MKIAFITEATSSGVGKHVMDLVCFFSQEGEDIYLIHSLNRVDSIYERRLSDIQAILTDVIQVPMRRAISPFNDLFSFFKIYNYFRNNDSFDVVHVHSSKAGFIGSLAAKLSHAGCVIFTPNAFASMGSSGFKKNFLLTLERLCGLLCDNLIAVSVDEYNYALTNGIVPKDKISIISNGVDVPKLDLVEDDRLNFRSEIGISPSTRLIGSIGRITAQKDPISLIELIYLRSKKYTPLQEKFVIVGGGDLESLVKQKIKEFNLEDYVLLMGFQDNVSTIFAGLDIYILHSRYEGMPYTVLEAMSYGLPVVSTKVPGIQELIRNQGLIADPADLQALDDALDMMVSLDYRNKVGRSNRDFLIQNFTCEKMCHQVRDIYHSYTSPQRNTSLTSSDEI